MAVIAKSGTPSLCTVLPTDPHRLPPLLVGEDIAAGDACYVKSDGKIWRSNGTANDAVAVVDGFAPMAAKVAQRQPLSLYTEANFNYGAGLSPGTFVYLFTTAGAIGTATTTGGLTPCGRVIDATRIRLFKSY